MMMKSYIVRDLLGWIIKIQEILDLFIAICKMYNGILRILNNSKQSVVVSSKYSQKCTSEQYSSKHKY